MDKPESDGIWQDETTALGSEGRGGSVGLVFGRFDRGRRIVVAAAVVVRVGFIGTEAGIPGIRMCPLQGNLCSEQIIFAMV